MRGNDLQQQRRQQQEQSVEYDCAALQRHRLFMPSRSAMEWNDEMRRAALTTLAPDRPFAATCALL